MPEPEETSPVRRLIIVVVEAGEEPEIEYDPPASFMAWEVVAALNRAVQIVEEEEILSALDEEDDDGS